MMIAHASSLLAISAISSRYLRQRFGCAIYLRQVSFSAFDYIVFTPMDFTAATPFSDAAAADAFADDSRWRRLPP